MRSTVITRRCDRCTFEQVEDGVGQPESWGRMGANQYGGAFSIGIEGDPTDLCPSCVEALKAWYVNPAGDPPPPPAPPPIPSPVWSLVDRRNAIQLVQQALALRVTYALEVVRAEPTVILSGEVIPGALFGIEESAAGVVDGVIDQLGLQRQARR